MPDTEKTRKTVAPVAPRSAAPAPIEDEPTEPGFDAEEYEKLLDMYDVSFRNFAEGEVVRGVVLRVSESEVIVDIGYKSEGMIPLEEFRDENGQITVKAGDAVDVLLEKTEDHDGYVVLSKEKAEKMKVWDDVERAYQERRVVEGRVIERVKGGLAVDIGVRAFLPGSQVDMRPVRNLDALKGQELRMRVIKVNKKRGNIVLSRKAVLEKEHAERKTQTLETLEEGKVLNGIVKNITEYGAFVDLGGIDGLLHITDMSWGRVNHPCEVFNGRRRGRRHGAQVRPRDRARVARLEAAAGRPVDDRDHEVPGRRARQGQGREPHRLRRLRRARAGRRGPDPRLRDVLDEEGQAPLEAPRRSGRRSSARCSTSTRRRTASASA